MQLELFGRPLVATQDVLVGYGLTIEKIYGQFPVIRVTGSDSDRIEGLVYEVTLVELDKADAYEGSAYKRIKTCLASGKWAWVYVGN